MNRKNEFDNLKGIMIFLVVVGHLTTLYKTSSDKNYIGCINMIINTFHMPIFCFISGLFSKKEIFANEAVKLLRGCLIPFIMFNFLHWLISSRSIVQIFEPQWTMWYLISLFFWKLLAIPISKLKLSYIWVLLFSLFAGCIEYGQSMALTRTVAFFPFFYIGFLIDTKKIYEWKKNIKGAKLLIPIIVIFLMFFLIFCSYQFGITEEIVFLRKSYLDMGLEVKTGIIYRLITIIISFVLIWCFVLLAPSNKTIITILGRNSIVVYLCHSFIISFIRKFDIFPNNMFFFIMAIVTVAAFICALTGNNYIANAYNRIMDTISKILVDSKQYQNQI